MQSSIHDNCKYLYILVIDDPGVGVAMSLMDTVVISLVVVVMATSLVVAVMVTSLVVVVMATSLVVVVMATSLVVVFMATSLLVVGAISLVDGVGSTGARNLVHKLLNYI